MTELKLFREINKLTQQELGDYVGMKKSFVSKVENGKEKMPRAKLDRILNNDRGWDVSMLVSETSPKFGDTIRQTGGRGNIGKIDGDCGELLALRREVEMLRAMVEELRAEKAEYWEMIKTLSGK